MGAVVSRRDFDGNDSFRKLTIFLLSRELERYKELTSEDGCLGARRAQWLLTR